MHATLGTRRRCPYCSAQIALGDCPIVATSFPGVEFRAAGELDANEVELPSGTRPTSLLPKTHWPVIAPAPRDIHNVREVAPKRPLGEVFGPRDNGGRPGEDAPLPPLVGHNVFEEDVPARACPRCEFPLPGSIDHREAVVVAVAGVNRVGKTHLLAASLTQANRDRALAAIGCTEFVPDDATSTRFLTDYFLPLFRRNELLAPTQAEDHEVRFQPLVFNVTLPEVEPFSLVLHDVAGEVLGDHRKRALDAMYLRGARGIIFVVDPRDIDDLRDGLSDWVLENNQLGWDQGALLASCLRADETAARGRRIPVAVTVGKADLLPHAASEPMPFLAPAPAGESKADFAERIRRYSREVADFLERHGAHSVLGPVREYEERLRAANGSNGNHRSAVTYHAVSALGSVPDADEKLTEKVRPLNCVDPLAAILLQLMSD